MAGPTRLVRMVNVYVQQSRYLICTTATVDMIPCGLSVAMYIYGDEPVK